MIRPFDLLFLARNLVEKRIQYYDPRMLERKAKQKVPDERLKESIDIITFKAGFTTVYVHSTSPDEVAFVRYFGEKILPYFTSQ
jgi:coenzyme F420-dependent glucose-6-phosphate dehydrogenase